jgi:hypothetical protein
MLRQATDVLPACPGTRRQAPPRPGARRPFPWGDRRWLDGVRAEIAGAPGHYRNWRRHREHIAELIAAHADRWLHSRPTLAVLIELSGLSRRTVQDACRWLERGGWLTVLEHGTTPRYAPGRLRPEDESLAREWLLAAPGENCTPTHTPTAGRPSAGAREDPPVPCTSTDEMDRRVAPDSSPLGPVRTPGPLAELAPGQKPRRRAAQLTACETLQRQHMVLRRLSARSLRSILRPWCGSVGAPAACRYSPADVLHAIEHLPPDGSGSVRQHEYATRVADPAAWLEHRMSFWLDADGRPLLPHSAELADRAAGHRSAQDRERARREAVAAGRSADPVGRADEARRMLFAALGRPLPGRVIKA